ncbi:hypothetical protein ENUP19_0086G0012 [Entamoeba nuttalli]|uniref:Uncharacterized protein n=1 Tax=Entamoeba nuttalli TaxID=412467 RepID=A0ABQ0DGF9_9EUKA
MSLYDNIKFVVLEGAVSSDEPDVSGEYLHNSPIFNCPVVNKTKTILEGERGIKELRAGYLSYWNLINQKDSFETILEIMDQIEQAISTIKNEYINASSIEDIVEILKRTIMILDDMNKNNVCCISTGIRFKDYTMLNNNNNISENNRERTI